MHGVIKVSSQIQGEGNGTPLQYSCLENPMDRGAWGAAVHGVAKSQTRLSDFTFTHPFRCFHSVMKDFRDIKYIASPILATSSYKMAKGGIVWEQQ